MRYINPNPHPVTIPNHLLGRGMITIHPHEARGKLPADAIFEVTGDAFAPYVALGQLCPFRAHEPVEQVPAALGSDAKGTSKAGDGSTQGAEGGGAKDSDHEHTGAAAGGDSGTVGAGDSDPARAPADPAGGAAPTPAKPDAPKPKAPRPTK